MGAGVGRMSFPAVLAPALQVHLQGVIDSASQATDLLGRADSLYFLSGVARVGWNGTKKPGG